MTSFREPTDLRTLFEVAMNREVPIFSPGVRLLPRLNLGAGFKQIQDTIELDLPKWDAETMPIPYGNETIGAIYAFGFFEHISNVPKVLKECQRVLAPEGTLNIMVSYYSSNMAHEDLYHKSWFAEGTWRNLFHNEYWKADDFTWRFNVGINLIIGVVERNLCLLTQLIKE